MATVGALIFAAIAAVAAQKVYKIESARDHEAEKDRQARDLERRRTQAARISAWAGNKTYTAGPALPQLGIFVRNASQLPVFDLALRFCWRQGPSFYTPLGKAPPSAGNPDGRFEHLVPVLPPEDEPIFVPLPGEVRDNLHRSLWEHVVPELVFRDAEGIRWHREANGVLTELR